MCTTSIITVSPTLSIELPQDVADRLKVSSGDKLRMVETSTGVELQRIDGELAEQLAAFDKVMDEDDEALRRLAE
jgi:putative addiction module antidote